MLTVIERARRYISKCPPAISGQRGHNKTFHVAGCLVQEFGLGDADALALLREWNANCVPPWSEPELVHKINSARKAPHKEPRGYLLRNGLASGADRPLPIPSPKAATPPVNPIEATELFLKGFRCGEAELIKASPVFLGDDPRVGGAILIDALYLPGELVNFVTEFTVATDETGKEKARPTGMGVTLERDLLVARFLTDGPDSGEGGAWLRMNPLDGHGIADVNVTAFRFALLESDELPVELQLSLFAKLPLPVAALIKSGGTSIHAWAKVDAPDQDDYRATVAGMLAILAKFGLDQKNKNPSRLSRLPGARREIGAVGDGLQRLLYLNPNPEGKAIL
jgi:hypothetical protein